MSARPDWTDSELVEACIRGDAEAWSEFVARFGRVVYGTAAAVLTRHGLGQRRDLADDIYQEVFSDFWEKKRLELIRDRARVKPFVAAVAVSHAVDALRRIRRSRERGAEETNGNGASAVDTAGAPGPDPAEAARRSEIQSVMDGVFSGLTAKESTIMRLTLDEELSHAEIGELLNIPKDTVSTVARRTREKIRQILEEKGISEL